MADGAAPTTGGAAGRRGPTRATVRRALAGWDVLLLFALLVGPLAIGRLDGDLMTPLALPGYLLLTLGSALGSRLAPQYAVWLYWIPFVVGSYAVSVVLAATVRPLWDR